MKIEHIAIWVKDLEKMKTFYVSYFNGTSSSKYHNKDKEFESYFLTFDGGARLEIMRKSGIDKPDMDDRIGWAHIAISLGSRESVNQMTARLQNDGYKHVNGPRVTGDGYYESVMEDPEGNLLELTV
ncbi:glyoxalase/bleomycin resistance/extradiol dioxygenase family protein [Robertmurraya yapensis]|uniref:Glyoxalase/bleomycin resistance/extradiol dioxygenase family protein n=2 Tax=Bacillaceae TaxID=186817 RepID=A0A431W192_9BACI|nr:VOC family protein [Bacillus yapensis]RTR29195.1 glyoxalase/bleomycin resistance/extradiol dioxygenase family protein [Bacillus yapensis]TKS94800.1 glyoxalase/bleomycin resistance/extradiol dioxygenase family protein [Bacillus yapensis]